MTATTTATLKFTVDAVRVSKVNNPGNLQGLASVKRGTKVWLMLYYTIDSMPRTLTRVTSYMVLNHGKPLFSVTYRDKEKASDVGRFSRYTVYTIPKTLPYGQYTYHATLTLGGQLRSKSWRFLVGKQERIGRLSTH